MNVSLTNVDSVNAILQINVTKEDYQEKLDNALKTFRKKLTYRDSVRELYLWVW